MNEIVKNNGIVVYAETFENMPTKDQALIQTTLICFENGLIRFTYMYDMGKKRHYIMHLN